MQSTAGFCNLMKTVHLHRKSIHGKREKDSDLPRIL